MRGIIAFTIFCWAVMFSAGACAEKEDGQEGVDTTMAQDSAVLSIYDCRMLIDPFEHGIIIGLENNVDVCALQTDILFDTRCFWITTINKTARSREMDIFVYSDIEGGIRIAISSLGGSIHPGRGSIVMFRTLITECCYEGSYLWDITNSIVEDPLGVHVPVEEKDGFVTVWFIPRGDVNADGGVDVLDVILAVRIATGNYSDPTDEELWAADCNLDGVIDVTDVLHIVDWIIELGECLPDPNF